MQGTDNGLAYTSNPMLRTANNYNDNKAGPAARDTENTKHSSGIVQDGAALTVESLLNTLNAQIRAAYPAENEPSQNQVNQGSIEKSIFLDGSYGLVLEMVIDGYGLTVSEKRVLKSQCAKLRDNLFSGRKIMGGGRRRQRFLLPGQPGRDWGGR